MKNNIDNYPTSERLQEMKEKGFIPIKCNCECHMNEGILHIVACCEDGYRWMKVDTEK